MHRYAQIRKTESKTDGELILKQKNVDLVWAVDMDSTMFVQNLKHTSPWPSLKTVIYT